MLARAMPKRDNNGLQHGSGLDPCPPKDVLIEAFLCTLATRHVSVEVTVSATAATAHAAAHVPPGENISDDAAVCRVGGPNQSRIGDSRGFRSGVGFEEWFEVRRAARGEEWFEARQVKQ